MLHKLRLIILKLASITSFFVYSPWPSDVTSCGAALWFRV